MSRGPFAAAGPYEDGREVRLEKVPGGLRLAAWHAGQLVKDAPVIALARPARAMLRSAADQGLVEEPELEPAGREPVVGSHGASPGRTGELRDELRVERHRRRPREDRALDHASQPGLGAAGGARAAPGGPVRRSAAAPPPSAACSRQAIRWSSDYLRVPLKLVTGPANAAKAGEVLGGLRARLDDDPILVVPTFSDVEHSQRELAERGAVFGARVMRFDWLFAEIADTGRLRRPPGVRLPARADRGGRGRGARSSSVLAESAAQPGFVRAAARFVTELTRSMVEPARLTQALRAWAGDGPRRAYAEEVAAVYRAYRDALEAADLVDPELFAWRAVDALREGRAWGAAPLFVYGFDDFTPLEIRALDTIANWCGADVTVSLPYEPGRLAFKAVSGMHQELLALGAEELELAPLDDHYAAESREALHHVERLLFEDEPGRRVQPGSAIAFHCAGGERAEVELAGARVLQLLRDGVEPGDVAVVFRDPVRYSSLLEQVFGAYKIPYSIDRKLPFGHTGLGRGLLALIRAAGPGGSADDLLTYLRTPGLLRVPGFADSLEAEVRSHGAHSAAAARECWERDHWPLGELDRLAQARDTAAFVAELEARLARLFAAPYERTATVLSGPQLEEARALSTAQRALVELRSVLGGRRVDAQHVLRVLKELEVHLGETPQPDRVQVATPEAIRARRFHAVFACGLLEGEFPRGASPEPFLSDEDRRAIASASGLALPVREDRLDRERYLFYICASRAERLLVLSSRSSDEEGNPQTESYFVDDVRALMEDGAELRTRSLSEVTWVPDDAPTAAELDRAHAASGPRRPVRAAAPLSSPPLLEELAGRDAVAARALENFADCPVKWLVEDILRPDELVPDPEAMVRGSYAHEVLSHTYRRLHEESGERRVTPGNLEQAERILLEELRERSADFQLSPKQTRVRAAARRLEFDLLRFLRSEADSESRFEPVELERQFGLEGSEPVELEGGLRVRGRIDRVDRCDGLALVIDYKTGRKVDTYKVASWEPENRFQAALYMLVVEKLLGAPRRRRRVRGARQRRPAPARDGGRGRGRARRALVRQGPARARGVPGEARLGARAHPRDGRAHAQGRALLAAGQLRLERRLQVPVGVQERAVRELTEEQRRAVERRDGSLLVRAGAGTGKTTVLVERFVQAVTEDGIEVEQVLAITFTEKAAAEMRARVRRRFLELGRRDDARAAESAWISTIHGLCAQDPARARAQRGHRPRLPRARRGGLRAHRRRRLRRGARGVHGRGRLRARPRPRRDGRRVHPGSPARHGPHRVLAPPQHGEAPSAARGVAAAAAGRRGRAAGGRGTRRAGGAGDGGRRRERREGDRDDRAARRAEEREREGALHRRLRGVPRRVRRARRGRGGGARAPRPHDAACAARALRRALRPRQARPLGARLRGPRAGGARPPGRRRGAPRGLLVPLRARAGGRVPGHEPAPERAAGAALAREPVPRRRREPVDLPLPERGRRACSASTGRRLARGAAPRASR